MRIHTARERQNVLPTNPHGLTRETVSKRVLHAVLRTVVNARTGWIRGYRRSDPLLNDPSWSRYPGLSMASSPENPGRFTRYSGSCIMRWFGVPSHVVGAK